MEHELESRCSYIYIYVYIYIDTLTTLEAAAASAITVRVISNMNSALVTTTCSRLMLTHEIHSCRQARLAASLQGTCLRKALKPTALLKGP